MGWLQYTGFTQYVNQTGLQKKFIERDIGANMEKRFCKELLSCYRDFSTDLESNLIRVSQTNFTLVYFHEPQSNWYDNSKTQMLSSLDHWITAQLSIHAVLCAILILSHQQFPVENGLHGDPRSRLIGSAA